MSYVDKSKNWSPAGVEEIYHVPDEPVFSSIIDEVFSTHVSLGTGETNESIDSSFDNITDSDRELIDRVDASDFRRDYLALPWTREHLLPAYEAALKSDIATLQEIVNFGIPLDNFDMKTGETPLHAACRRGNVKIFNLIYSHSSKHSLRNREGRTPFMCGVISNNIELVSFMAQRPKKFGCNLSDNLGRNALMLAGLNGNSVIFKYLKIMGYDYLKKDLSDRSLISIINSSNPVYEIMLKYLKNDISEKGTEWLSDYITDFSFLFLNSPTSFYHLLAVLEISISDIIMMPQTHDKSFLMNILRQGEFNEFFSFVRSSNFNVKSKDTEGASFINRSFQICPLSVIYKLIRYYSYDGDSLKYVIEADRVDVLDILLKLGVKSNITIDGLDIISYSGVREANNCFKYLLKKYWRHDNFQISGCNLFCGTALRICQSENVSSIKNLFRNFGTGMKTCSPEIILEISDIVNDLEDSMPVFSSKFRVFLSKLDYSI